MGDLSDTVGAHLTAVSVTKPATLLGVFRAAVSKVMKTHTNHGKRNSGRKPKLSERESPYNEEDCV